MGQLLEVADLRMSYGAVQAVDAVLVTVTEGEIVGLVSPNRAGKSSIMDAFPATPRGEATG